MTNRHSYSMPFTAAELHADYYDSEMTQKEVGEKWGISQRCVHTAMRKCGFPARKPTDRSRPLNRQSLRLPTQERLQELFRYDPFTGGLVRKVSVSGKSKAGEIAGSIHSRGYIYIYVDNQKYFAHRIIWKYVYGVDPQNIDHINQKEGDNRLHNLRSVSQLVNTQNRSIGRNNTSGFVGVVFQKPSKKWIAQIKVGGKSVHLGTFSDKAQAVATRKRAEVEYGFHENHGT